MKHLVQIILFFLVIQMGWSQAGTVTSLSTVRHDSIDTPVQAGSFGISVSSIGDLNNDGVEDIVVGAMNVGPSSNRGTIYVLFMNNMGEVLSSTKIASGLAGFTQATGFDGRFGESLANLGDIDGDGTTELAVGNPLNNGQGFGEGVVWILSIKSDGTVARSVKIGENSGGFLGGIENDERFGFGVSAMPDVDNDGVPELLVGSPYRDVNGLNTGRVYLLKLKSDGTVKDFTKFDNTTSGIAGLIGTNYLLGQAVTSINDIDNNGIPEIVLGMRADTSGYGTRGSIWLLFLDNHLGIKSVSRLSNNSPGFSILDSVSFMGRAVTNLGDIDGDGVDDIATGASDGQIGSTSTDLIRLIFLNSSGGIKSTTALTAKSGTPFAAFSTPGFDFSGRALAVLNDINGDGKRDIIAGAPAFNNGNGQIHILTLDGISHIGLEEESVESNPISIFPNPTTGSFQMELSEEFSNQKLQLTMLDAAGRKLAEWEVDGSSTATIEVDGKQPSGIYFLRCKGKDMEHTSKIIISD